MNSLLVEGRYLRRREAKGNDGQDRWMNIEMAIYKGVYDGGEIDKRALRSPLLREPLR